ncbi:MAG TPA: molecular chaperone TorD family protein [Gaiellaceae bacterium]|nr:molecular chaperone TorD family protein [Gaiellaceae bacterium]
MELLRALAVLCEPPAAEHRRIGGLLRLPGEPRPDDYAEVFLFQLYPYASVYLGAEGKLGGEARDRVAGFWRALELVPPPEPDHLAALLGLYAGLAEAEAPAQWRRALLWEHLLSWTPPYLAKLEEVAPPFYRGWARLLREALAAEAAALGPLPSQPLAHRDAPPLQPPSAVGGAAFLEQLLAPLRTGVVLVRDDLVAAARELGLGLRVAERRYVLEALLAQDARATLDWLAAQARRWAARHEPGFWSGRAAAAAILLAEAARGAAEQEVVHAR